jgi:hypothetical protein
LREGTGEFYSTYHARRFVIQEVTMDAWKIIDILFEIGKAVVEIMAIIIAVLVLYILLRGY